MFINDNFHSVKEIALTHTGLSEQAYLHPDSHPYIHHLEEASQMIKTFISQHPDQQITIVGDYDADGICATAILGHILNRLVWSRQTQNRVKTRLPRRFSEGYGLSERIIDEIPEGLVITVDNGIAAIDAVHAAKEKGLTVIVTDHHLPSKNPDGSLRLPEADIIVDPHADASSTYKDYCGAGLAFRLAEALLPNSNLLEPLKVVASIATVADVMQIKESNWLLVKEGLEEFNAGNCLPTLTLLADRLYLKGHVTASDYGFKFAPILNASGRLYDNGAERSLNFLKFSSKNSPIWNKAVEITHALIGTNDVRKGIVRDIMDAYIHDDVRPIVKRMPDGTGEGIIGLIAGQLCEKYHCPAIIFTKAQEPGKLKGSGRSIDEIHLKQALDAIEGIDFKYGGHAGAAGMTINETDLDAFRIAFTNACGQIPKKDPHTHYDMEITVDQIPQILEELDLYAPFGEGNPEPVFLIRGISGEYTALGQNLSFSIMQPGLKVFGYKMNSKYRQLGNPRSIDCVGTLGRNYFRDTMTPQLQLIDFQASI